MTQPKVKEYIEARVRDTGDTMSGPLVINNLNTNASLVLFSQEDIGVVQVHNNNNWLQRRSLIIKNIEYAPTLNDVLTLGILDDGTWKEYNILHTGNYSNYILDKTSSINMLGDINNSDNLGAYSSIFRTTDSDCNGVAPSGYSVVCRFRSGYNGSYDLWLSADANGNFYMSKTADGLLVSTNTWRKLLDSNNFNQYALPLSGGTMNGILYTNGLRMKTTTIRVNGDLNTYYPVCINTSMPNTEGITIYVSKSLGTVSPAWTGNHPSGASSCMAGYYLRNNGWDGNGEFCYNISPVYQGYAKIIGHVEVMRAAAHHLVLQLRGGGADYTLAGSIPLKIQIGYEEINLGNDTFPNKVSPMTSTDNLGWYNFESPFLSIKGGTVDGNITANAVYGAVWNDYAEYRSSDTLEPGRVVIETGEGDLILATERLQSGANIISDTFGFAIGETDKCQTPIAVSGRVLAYPYEDRDEYAAGDPVCSGPGGTISKMTHEEVREYPDRIIGTVSEIPKYETWGTGNVQVNGRIWIKV